MDEKDNIMCWINADAEVLSFHWEEGYTRMVFDTRTELFAFVTYRIACGYKVQ